MRLRRVPETPSTGATESSQQAVRTNNARSHPIGGSGRRYFLRTGGATGAIVRTSHSLGVRLGLWSRSRRAMLRRNSVGVAFRASKLSLVFLQLSPKLIDAAVDGLLIGRGLIFSRQTFLVDVDVDLGLLFLGRRVAFTQNNVRTHDAVVEAFKFRCTLFRILADVVGDVDVSSRDLSIHRTNRLVRRDQESASRTDMLMACARKHTWHALESSAEPNRASCEDDLRCGCSVDRCRPFRALPRGGGRRCWAIMS